MIKFFSHWKIGIQDSFYFEACSKVDWDLSLFVDWDLSLFLLFSFLLVELSLFLGGGVLVLLIF